MNTKLKCAKLLGYTFWNNRKENPYCDQRQYDWNEIPHMDKRGKHGNHRKIDPEILASFTSHINSIPPIQSHYVRSDTTREYIDGGLTIAEMHRYYSSERASANLQVANYDTYSRIFNSKFIGFFLPKKDQCDVCKGYKNVLGKRNLSL